MTLAELMAAAREDADDTAVGSFWSDAVLTRYANQAQDEAARRARLILDSETATERVPAGGITDPLDPGYVRPPNVCEYPVTTGTRFIVLHPKIMFVKTVKVDGRPLPVPRIHVKDLEERIDGWENADVVAPIAYIPNKQAGSLWFYSGFAEDSTVRLTVIRRPLYALENLTDEPEIPEHLHEYLTHWMVFRMLMKPDEDIKNATLANGHLALFEQQFGRASSAIDEAWISREHGYDEYEGIY